jgi:bifunctional UDP-N-acetylglucosamine pyrophosphorylase/glucosamine-1-phosphate N-acetyltransferase
MSLSIVILAAGKGTRMKSNIAKVLHPICGQAMLHHIIKQSQKVSDDITIVLAHQADEISKMIYQNFNHVNIILQDLEQYPGTGGALKNYTPKHDKTLILNGDMPLIEEEDLNSFLNFEDTDILMSTFKLNNPTGYGRVIIENEQVQRIVEQKDANEKELKVQAVNAGIYLFSKTVLNTYIPKLSNNNKSKEYYLTDIIAMAKADRKNIKALSVNEEKFKGVNSKLDLSDAQDIMLDRIRKYWMSKGVSMRMPKSIYIETSVIFKNECVVENNVSILGESIIDNSTIKTNTVIENATIKNSDIGPTARIRPASLIIDSHIGNFVEVKKSTLKGVKAGHLSYMGDATIDEGSNIGAGVITCNYDGINKYQTIIGKNVFIGSDSQLIAPITIEDDVMIGAGTTLSQDRVAKGGLALNRAPMKIIEGFFYKFFKKKA